MFSVISQLAPELLMFSDVCLLCHYFGPTIREKPAWKFRDNRVQIKIECLDLLIELISNNVTWRLTCTVILRMHLGGGGAGGKPLVPTLLRWSLTAQLMMHHQTYIYIYIYITNAKWVNMCIYKHIYK